MTTGILSITVCCLVYVGLSLNDEEEVKFEDLFED